MTEPTAPTSALYAAILAVQAEAPAIQKSKLNPAFRSKYVSLDALHEVVMPLINKHGLVWVTEPHGVGTPPDVTPSLRYRLIHAESGEDTGGTMPLMLAKNDPQGQGSAITYARRYALMAVLGLVADEDDDGNTASGRPKPRSGKETRAQRTTRTPTPEGHSEAKDASEDDPPVSTETLEKVAAATRKVGLTVAQWKAIVKEVGAEGKKSNELTQGQADWVLLKLGTIEQAA